MIAHDWPQLYRRGDNLTACRICDGTEQDDDEHEQLEDER